MNAFLLTPPKLGFVISTRAALAFGLGLLASSRLSHSKRRALGTALVAVGALTTIPAVWMIARSRKTDDLVST